MEEVTTEGVGVFERVEDGTAEVIGGGEKMAEGAIAVENCAGEGGEAVLSQEQVPQIDLHYKIDQLQSSFQELSDAANIIF